MNSLNALLAARSHQSGHGFRSAAFRHRRLMKRPIAIVFWQLGAEPFSAAAFGWGRAPDDLSFAAAGDPRNRDLAFSALLPFARWFNPRFEAPAAHQERVQRGRHEYWRATTIPQVIVPNTATAAMIGRLGRRLAYLPADGPRPADPALIRLGQHFLFLERHGRRPGQQVIVALSELMQAHWVTAQTDLERASLAALDAFIDPPTGVHGFIAAAQAEMESVGPIPSGEEDTMLEPLVETFNRQRAGRTDLIIVRPLLGPIEAHYRPLIQRTWTMLWRCFERERAFPEAPSCERRVNVDCEEYTRHMDWTASVGRWRTRQTARQAAMTMRDMEDAQALVLAEEATDDRLRMIPYLLDGKAIEGRVLRINLDHREIVHVNAMRRPLVTIACEDPCRLAPGRKLYWSRDPAGPDWVVHAVDNRPGRVRVTMKLQTSSGKAALPALAERACFSTHTTSERYIPRMSCQPPWTHIPTVAPEPPAPIEETEG
jgi:hypothetical protein